MNLRQPPRGEAGDGRQKIAERPLARKKPQGEAYPGRHTVAGGAEVFA